MSSCIKEGEQKASEYYSRPNVTANEIRTPETVVPEQIGFTGEIILPKVYSPKKQFESIIRSRLPEQTALLSILHSLVTAEKVARRQYDELMFLPAFQGYNPEALHLRNDEYEHQLILECIIRKISGKPTTTTTTPTIQPQQPQTVSMTRQQLKDIYLIILDRFDDKEIDDIREYEDFLRKVNNTIEIASKAGNTEEVEIPLSQMQRHLTRIIKEKISHRDTIEAIKDMILAP